jgi:dephospho-CoA kinase
MLKIGITGGIGSGKTTVCKVFELLNVPVFYADLQARELMAADEELISGIKSAFGSHIYLDGLLNRGKLASVVFNDSDKLDLLNSLVHPAVFKAFHSWVEQQKAPYILKEAALLFESGSYKDCNLTVLVKSPQELKIERIIKRDKLSKDEVLKRMSKQLGDEEKERLSNYIINNNEQDLLIPQVLYLHEQFLNLSPSINS